jgi:hypothetical protein
MYASRRDFMKSLGIALASMFMARRVPVGSGGDSVRDRLRNCWLMFDWLAQQARVDYEQGEKVCEQLINNHRQALDLLVESNELSQSVAEQIQIAFEATANHIRASSAPIECYFVMILEPPDYASVSINQLHQQVEILKAMTKNCGIHYRTISQVQTAIERDIAFLRLAGEENATLAQVRAIIERDISFLNLSEEETATFYKELTQSAQGTDDYPSFNELALEIPSEAAKAARFLVELLLEKQFCSR